MNCDMAHQGVQHAVIALNVEIPLALQKGMHCTEWEGMHCIVVRASTLLVCSSGAVWVFDTCAQAWEAQSHQVKCAGAVRPWRAQLTSSQHAVTAPLAAPAAGHGATETARQLQQIQNQSIMSALIS
jgi:hypothetical protein